MRKQNILNTLNMYLCKPNACTEFEMDPALVRVIQNKNNVYLSTFLGSFYYGLKIEKLKLPGKKSFGVMSINSINIRMTKSVRNDLYPHFTSFWNINLKIQRNQ